jgi:hypothetical protein
MGSALVDSVADNIRVEEIGRNDEEDPMLIPE